MRILLPVCVVSFSLVFGVLFGVVVWVGLCSNRAILSEANMSVDILNQASQFMADGGMADVERVKVGASLNNELCLVILGKKKQMQCDSMEMALLPHLGCVDGTLGTSPSACRLLSRTLHSSLGPWLTSLMPLISISCQDPTALTSQRELPDHLSVSYLCRNVAIRLEADRIHGGLRDEG